MQRSCLLRFYPRLCLFRPVIGLVSAGSLFFKSKCDDTKEFKIGRFTVFSYHLITEEIFLASSHSEHLFPCFAPKMALQGFFILPPYGATGNQTPVISVAPPWGALIQDALPTKLSRPQHSQGVKKHFGWAGFESGSSCSASDRSDPKDLGSSRSCNIGLNFVSLFLLFAILTMVQQFREIEKPSWSKKKQKKLKKTLSKSSAEPLRQQLRRLPH